uniref:AAA+ ATPase domain-containing protein n=2 Tax=Nitrosospira lacus TaxID=1288494 RepID=A0A1W6SQU1_9PROT
MSQTAPKTELSFKPINLKWVLLEYGIPQPRWADAIMQSHGKALSRTGASHIINWGLWPKLTPREAIVTATERMLRDRGVPEATLTTLWDFAPKAQPQLTRVRARTGQTLPAIPQIDIEPLEVVMLSAQAKSQFKIFRDPFTDDVQSADDIFLSADQRYIREAMFTTARHGGFLAVVGESGAGKTVLRRDLIDRVQRESHPVIVIQPRLIDKGTLTAGSICEAIIDDMRPSTKTRRSLEGKARQVERILTDSSRAGNTHVLLIEEAHDLSVSTLKYLKRFWELEDGFKKLLSIILVGQPELKNKLDERMNYEAREVIRRCEIAELMPLNAHLENYLALKFKRVGKDLQDICEADAFDAMRARLTRPARSNSGAVSMIYPLIINNLTTKAMNLCAEIGAPRINADLVKAL